MKITELRCAVIGKHPFVRIVTDENINGLGEVEYTKTYLKPWVLHFKEALIGEDPPDVERCMMKIRQRGRTCALGYRGKGRERSGVQAPRRQGARPGPHLHRQQAPQALRRPAGG